MKKVKNCPYCGKSFDNYDDLLIHQISCNKFKVGKACRFCGKKFFNEDELMEHELHCGK